MSYTSKKSKFLASTITAAVVASAVAPAAGFAASDFKDVPADSLYADYVNALATAKIIDGRPDGTFDLGGKVNRAEASKMVANILKLDTKKAPVADFKDVDQNKWYAEFINALYAEKLINGKGAGKFEPTATLTRGEFAKMVVEAYDLELNTKGPKANFKDVDGDKWYADYIEILFSHELVSGTTATTFSPNAPIKRADFAKLLTQTDWAVGSTLEKPDAEKVIESVQAVADITVNEGEEVVLPKTVKVTYTDKTTEDVAVDWNTSKIDFAKVGTYNVTGTIEGTDKTASVKVVVKAVDPEVATVKAKNAKEVEVTFNKAVYADSVATTDFAVTATGTSTTIAVSDVQVSEDGKSALLLLSAVVPEAGVDVEIAEGDILTKDYDKFPKSVTKAVKAPEDKAAPKLVSAKFVSGSDIELTFDEPVKWNVNSPVVKIDQVQVSTPSVSTEAGKYVYTISAGSALADGKHSVELTNVTDFAGNKNVLITKEVTVSQDLSAAKVASIAAENPTSFVLTFSKAVQEPAKANFVIKKGSYTLSNDYISSIDLVDKDGNAVSSGVTSSKYVKVTLVNPANTVNPLYTDNEKSIDLSVQLKGYKDDASVLGTEYNGSVTLSKEFTAPAIQSEKLISSTATTIVVPFDKTLASDVDAKVTVKQGNVLVAASSSVSGKNLTLTFAANVLEAGKTYTITLDKGAVTDSNDKTNEAVTFNYTVPAATVTYTVPGSSVAGVTNVDGKNVITVTYAGEVNDEAGLASSYRLDDSALPAGTDVFFTDADKDTVKIVLPSSYKVNTEDKAAKLTVLPSTVKYDAAVATVGGKFVSGSATSATAYEEVITLKDNVSPTITKVEYVKNAAGIATGLKLTFSENVDDSTVDAANFVIKQNSTDVAYTAATGQAGTTDLVDDNIMILNFTTAATASGITLSTATDSDDNTLTDMYGNVLTAVTNISAK